MCFAAIWVAGGSTQNTADSKNADDANGREMTRCDRQEWEGQLNDRLAGCADRSIGDMNPCSSSCFSATDSGGIALTQPQPGVPFDLFSPVKLKRHRF